MEDIQKKEKEVKEVKKSTDSETFYLSIIQQFKLGFRPSQICKNLNITKQALNPYISSLKASGNIKKIGYGTWELLSEEVKKEVKKSTAVANINGKNDFTSFKPDSVRGHAFQFVLQLPQNLTNWDKREDIFPKLGISFKRLQIPANSQAIEFKGRKIHLTDKSIIIYEKESFISETAKESKSQAINHFLKLIKQLERELQANFSFGSRYRFRVSRQHYSLIKNALAKQYNDSGEKLEVYNDKGLWFLIDNSFNLNEAETVHVKTAVSDNEKVQKFFNYVKEVDVEEQFKEVSKHQQATSGILEQMDKNIMKITKILYEIEGRKE